MATQREIELQAHVDFLSRLVEKREDEVKYWTERYINVLQGMYKYNRDFFSSKSNINLNDIYYRDLAENGENDIPDTYKAELLLTKEFKKAPIYRPFSTSDTKTMITLIREGIVNDLDIKALAMIWERLRACAYKYEVAGLLAENEENKETSEKPEVTDED